MSLHSKPHVNLLKELGYNPKLRRKEPVMDITLHQKELTEAVENYLESIGINTMCFDIGDINFTQGRGPTGTSATVSLTSKPFEDWFDVADEGPLSEPYDDNAKYPASELEEVAKQIEEAPVATFTPQGEMATGITVDVDPATTAAILAIEDAAEATTKELEETIKVADAEIADGAGVFDKEPEPEAQAEPTEETPAASTGAVDFTV